MNSLSGSQKKYLRGLAHNRKPVVQVGQKYLTPQVVREIRQALDYHELIKVKCIGPKEKADKREIALAVSRETGCELVGMIGHILILFKQHPDPEKRRINPVPPLSPAQSEPQSPSHSDAGG